MCLILCLHVQSIEWRKTYEVDSLLEKYKSPEVLQKYDIGGRLGLDKEKAQFGFTLTQDLIRKVLKTYQMFYCLVYVKSRFFSLLGLYYSAHKRDIIKHYIRKMEFHERECIELSQQVMTTIILITRQLLCCLNCVRL